jgi:hypothetical protein
MTGKEVSMSEIKGISDLRNQNVNTINQNQGISQPLPSAPNGIGMPDELIRNMDNVQH